MLFLTMYPGDKIYMSNGVEMTYHRLNPRGKQISFGFTAPPEIKIYREKIWLAIQEENKQKQNDKESTNV